MPSEDVNYVEFEFRFFWGIVIVTHVHSFLLLISINFILMYDTWPITPIKKKKKKNFTKTTFMARPMIESGPGKFRSLILRENDQYFREITYWSCYCIEQNVAQVEGDLSPRMVTKYADILAIPLKHIFDLIAETLKWPDTWKDESVTLIPKVPIPSSIGELRNLSCTPFFLKVLESFILEMLRGEITLLKEQFGGVKGTSATHFTFSVLQEFMEAMETPNTVLNLMSVDYEKVFDRMDHSQCLQALRGLGASSESVGLVHAFLY